MRPVKIGDFLLGETISVGNFACVRVAHHQTTGEKYAVKVLDRRRMDLGVYEKQVRRESKILQSLDHPNIVRIKRIMKSRMCTYLFMEYVEGGELFQEIVDNIHLEEQTARHYFWQLTSAMSHAHEKQIVHRDIKPENILLDKARNNIKIIDFGMGWIRESENENGIMTTPCGTPKYMPPELLSHTGDNYCGAKIDVWSCGMVLFACLAGYLPYTGDTGDSTAILEQITRSQSIEFPEWFSEGARDVLNKALEKDPSKRIDMKGLRDHTWTRADGMSPATWLSARSRSPVDPKKLKPGVPVIHLDGSFGLHALEFSSPVTPTDVPFEASGDATPASTLSERIDPWKI